MKNQLKTLGISAAASVMLVTTTVNAGPSDFAGALEITQDLQWAADIADRAASYTTQLNQYATQILEWENQWEAWQRKIIGLESMVQNIGQLPENMKNQFINMAVQMKNQLEQGQAIAYTAANLDQRFRSTFKGFDEYLEKALGGQLDFTEEYKAMYQSTKDTSLNALKTLGIQEQDLQNDQVFMSKLRTAMNTAQGTEAAVAVANQLTYHQTESLQKLQKTIMTQANMQAQWIAKKNDDDAMRTAARDAFRKDRAVIDHNNNVPMP